MDVINKDADPPTIDGVPNSIVGKVHGDKKLDNVLKNSEESLWKKDLKTWLKLTRNHKKYIDFGNVTINTCMHDMDLCSGGKGFVLLLRIFEQPN